MGGRAKDTLRDLDVRPSKKRGQNFLINQSAIDAIASFGAPRAEEKLVEIGPGLGALTKKLIAVAPLTVIEIEPQFCVQIAQLSPDITVVNSDFREVDLTTLGEGLTIFGNIPYVFSTDIIFHLLSHRSHLVRAVLLLQKEFAVRLAAKPGGRDYGVISVMCQCGADVKLGPVIDGRSFHPPTKVDSQVIELTFIQGSRIDGGPPEWFRRVVQGAFQQRRKKILNSLRGSGFFTPEKVIAAFEETGIDPGRRAETLSLEEFAALSRSLRS